MALNKLKLNPISSIGSEFLPAATLPSSATFTASVSSPSLSGTHFGSGANLSSLNASCISSGTIANAYLPATVSVTTVCGTSVCGTHYGSGANLTALNASCISSGTIGNAYLPATVSVTTVCGTSLCGTSVCGTHYGSGANLTSLNASNIASGTISNSYLPATVSVTSVCGTHYGSGANLTALNASCISSGTISNSYLPATVSVTSVCGTHYGSGANLTSLNASNIASGTVGASYLPAIVTLEDLIIAASDETTNLTVGTSKVTFRMPYAMTLSSVRASVNTAPVGSTIIANIKQNGSSIFSTKVSIDSTEKTSTTAAVPAVLSTTSLTDDSEITIDIDQVGSTTPGKGLKIVFKGTRV